MWATAALARAMGPFNDLFPRWFGTRAWLLQGLDPYGAEVNDGIRAALGGAPGEALGAFVFGFVYPGYVALLLLPLALLPLPWAATLWLLLAQGATGLGAWMAWHGAGGRRAPGAGRPGGGGGPALPGQPLQPRLRAVRRAGVRRAGWGLAALERPPAGPLRLGDAPAWALAGRPGRSACWPWPSSSPPWPSSRPGPSSCGAGGRAGEGRCWGPP